MRGEPGERFDVWIGVLSARQNSRSQMHWLVRRSRRRDTDWDVFSGYPPDLTMRRRLRGKWEFRKATIEECRKFLRDEREFGERLMRKEQFKIFR